MLPVNSNGYCSLVTFREVFFVNKVHRKPENCGAKRVTVNGVNSNQCFLNKLWNCLFSLHDFMVCDNIIFS